MWKAAADLLKGLFGGGAAQIGKDQQAVTASSAGHHSPVITAAGNVLFNAPPTRPSAAERDAELLAEMQRLMPEIVDAIRSLLSQDPLIRDVIVLTRSTVIYNWPNTHGKFADDTHPDATRKFQILESHGLVRRVNRIGYQLSPRFVRMLEGQS